MKQREAEAKQPILSCKAPAKEEAGHRNGAVAAAQTLVCALAGKTVEHDSMREAIRVAAADTLGESGTLSALPALREVATDPASSVKLRIAALTAIGKLKAGVPTSASGTATQLAAANAAPNAAAGAAGTPSVGKAKLLTGPQEHWFLSTDVPLTKAEAVAFNEKTNQLELENEPSRFYVGIDFILGDLMSEKRSFLGNLVLKGMVSASKRPLDSVGAGIGLRGSYLERFGVDFELFTPFVGYTFTLEDEEGPGGGQKLKSKRNAEFRFGVSFNLDRARGWVGGDQ